MSAGPSDCLCCTSCLHKHFEDFDYSLREGKNKDSSMGTLVTGQRYQPSNASFDWNNTRNIEGTMAHTSTEGGWGGNVPRAIKKAVGRLKQQATTKWC